MSEVSQKRFGRSICEHRRSTLKAAMAPRRDYAPNRIDWAKQELPDAWTDGPSARGLRGAWRLLSHPFRRRSKVQLPPGLPGAEHIPKYALLEFHHLPNGNYSKRLTRGYIKGFEVSMLGEMKRTRHRMAADLAGAESVVDIGCGGARLSGHLSARGIPDVHALDPSPYMLQCGAKAYPSVTFDQGVMEAMPYDDGRFDGAVVIFVFHEMPPRYVHQGLAEVARVLRPGGCLLVAEPSPLHYQATLAAAWRDFGWRGLYFRSLAHLVHEPFVKAWHRFDLASAAAQQGLELEQVDEGMPIKYWRFRRVD